MKFKFNLEALLKHRSYLEEIARKEYFVAKQAADDSLFKINSMWKEIDNVRNKMMVEQSGGGHKSELLATMDEFINGHKVRLDREKQNLRELMLIADEKREILVEAAKEHKILIKLKEKMKERHKQVLKKKEVKAIDDIVTTRHKRSS
ncbi:MAG: flagellar export protein FliJ [Bdellovibrionales bacterium]|nr:flagellar export protein FliJ [Bdellovibrionales bacterium]